jgi:hypothetical protein
MCGISLNNAEVINSLAKYFKLETDCSLERERDSL